MTVQMLRVSSFLLVYNTEEDWILITGIRR